MTCIDVLGKACTAILANSSLVKKVVFPIAILPVKGVLASIFTQVVFTILLIIYDLISTQSLATTYLLIPILFLIQMLGLIGIAFILSSIGVYFRDIKDFVQAFTTIGLYLIPVLYMPEQVPQAVRGILYLNPFSYMVWCYQDIFFFGYFAHPYAWVVFILLSLVTFVFGYRVFRKLSIMFGSVL